MLCVRHVASSRSLSLPFLVVASVLASASTLGAQTTGSDFTIIALPDTQYYSESYPKILNSQMQWIVKNASSLNVKAVLGLGDIVNNGSSATEWATADSAYKLLDAAQIPYFAAIGNHDYKSNTPSGRTSGASNFNQYFGPMRYRSSYWSNPYWRNSYPSGSNENFYGVININGQFYLVLVLEFYPRNGALSWAAQVIQNNADKQVIIITHAYEYFDNTRISPCNSFDAEYYGLGADNDGDSMWLKLVRQYSNITMVLSGHEIRGAGQDAVGHRIDLGLKGNVVNQILSNYQNMTNGGNGYLRIMTFHPTNDTISVRTYSPYLNAYLSDSANQFTVPWHKWTQTGTASIKGVVKNISTCAGLPATVSFGGGSTVAGTAGNYSVTGVTPNSYTVNAQYPNYAPASRSIKVGPGLTASVKLFLGPGSGQITGVVDDSSGTAVSGATVQVTGGASSSSTVTVTTGSNGVYSSGPLTAATYQLTATASGYNPASASVTVGSGGVTKNLVLSTSSASSISTCTPGGVNPSVTICQPAANSTISSPVQITAATTDTHAVTYVQVWLDGTKKYEAKANSLSTAISMTTGVKHRLTVQALDNIGQIFKQTVYVTAGSASSGGISAASGGTGSSGSSGSSGCTASTVNPSVTMCSPTPNSSVASPVHVVALTTDSHSVNYTQVWVDGKKAYEINKSTLDTSLAMSPGTTHRVTVQAVDSANQVFKHTVYVAVN